MSLTGGKAPGILSCHFRPCSEGAIQQHSALRRSKRQNPEEKDGAMGPLTISFEFNGRMNDGGGFIHVNRLIQDRIGHQQTRIHWKSTR